MSNVSLLTAIGKKPTVIKKQVIHEMRVRGVAYQSCFLVVSKLSNSVILGNDLFLKNQVIIDCSKFMIAIRDFIVPSSDVTFGKPPVNRAAANEENDFKYIQILKIDDKSDKNCDSKKENISFSYNKNCPDNNNNSEIDKLLRCRCLHGPQTTKNISCSLSDDIDDMAANIVSLFLDKLEFRDLNKYEEFNDERKNSEDAIIEGSFDNIFYEEEVDFHDRFLFEYINASEFIDCPPCKENQKGALHDEYLNKILLIADEMMELSASEKDYFIRLMSKCERLFSPKGTSAKSFEYKFYIKPHKAIVKNSHTVPYSYRARVATTIDKMLELGIIEIPDSHYCNPLRIVIKRDETVRVCLDARCVNDIIESDHVSPPLISELMQKFYGVEFFSVANLAGGY